MLHRKYKYGKTSLPLLVTLTGCVLMFACFSSVNATEITKQLSVKGYELSRCNINNLRVVVKNAQQAKNILESLHLTFVAPPAHFSAAPVFTNQSAFLSYSGVFSARVKRSHYENLRSWLKQE